MAKSILTAGGRPAELGQHWYKNFLARHPELKSQFSRSLPQCRKDAEDPKIFKNWFELYASTVAIYGIAAEDQYNMDEKGVAMGVGDSSKVLIP